MSKAAIVSFSGGQDSTTCLFCALQNYDRVETVGFNYGQKNNVELICRKEILQKIQTQFPNFACRLGPDLVIDASTFGQVSSSALTGSGEAIVSEGKRGLPSSFVPARNLMFMTYIGARAYLRDIHTIITGVGQADFSGYPDCRRNTMDAMQKALSLGMDWPIEIVTPLMYRTKAQTWELAHEVGDDELVDFIVKETHTCYEGDREHFHVWGYGCGHCPACLLREKGFEEYQQSIAQ